MHARRHFMVLAIAVLAAMVLAALMLKEHGSGYRVGVVYPATGENARLGESVRHAAALAEAQANASMFRNAPARLRLIYRDTEGRPSTARMQFLALADVEKVPIVIGSVLSSDTKSFMQDAESRKVVVLANGSSDPSIRMVLGQPGNYLLRNWPSDDAEGVAMAGYSHDLLKLSSGYSLVADDPYARGLADAFARRFRSVGGRLAMEVYPRGDAEFQITIAKAAKSRPQFFYLVGFPAELAHLVVEIRSQLGKDIPILSAVGIESDEFFQIAASSADNIFYTAPYVKSGSPEYLEFAELYKTRYKEDPDITAAVTYDAVMLAADAIAHVGYSSDRINSYLHRVSDYPGVSGLTSFTEVGDVEKPVVIKRIEHGKRYLLEVFLPRERN